MGLSSDLISQFVKATNDNKKTETESTVYGTAVEYNGKIWVKLDGSDLLTPISTTTDVAPGERVTVMIKNHSATVTGNISSPAARTDDVKEMGEKVEEQGDKIAEFGTLIANKVSVEQLEAQNARIEELRADNLTVKETLTAHQADISELQSDNVIVKEKLTAAEADIDNLSANKLDAEVADVKYATVGNLEATDAKVHNLEGTYADFKVTTTQKLEAIDAEIEKLDVGQLSVEEADIRYAKIEQLNATNAEVDKLDAEVADVNTLIFGSASGETIHTSFANAVIAQLGAAQIKSAMIQSVSADKIDAGTVNTNNVTVQSADGKLQISDETIQISDGTRVRVQIGKDASNDYSINVWDESGNLMFSKGGITDKAIKEAIIRNDMVSDDANISASKLDISSLFTEINGSSETIKSSKIFLDAENQTLDAAFSEMTTDVDGVRQSVQSQGAQITATQNQISSKVWQQDISSAIDDLEIGGRNLFRQSGHWETLPTWWGSNGGGCSLDTSVKYLGYNTLKTTLPYGMGNKGEWIELDTSKVYTYSAMVKSSVDYAGQASVPLHYHCAYSTSDGGDTAGIITFKYQQILVAGEWALLYLTFKPNGPYWKPFVYYGAVDCNLNIAYLKLEEGNKPTDWTPAPEDLEGEVDTLSSQYSSLNQTVNSINATVGSHTTEISKKADNSTVTEVNNKVSQLEVNLNGFQSTVSSTYATKTEVDAIEIGGRNLIPSSTFKDPNNVFQSSVAWVFRNNGIYVPATDTGAYSYFGITLCEKLVVGETYTISCRVAASSSANYAKFSFGNIKYVDNNVQYYVKWCTTDEHKVVCTFEATSNILTMTVYPYANDTTPPPADTWMYAYDIKLELGNKPTDWTPAPEDMASKEEMNAAIEVKADSINSTVNAKFANYSTTEQMNSAIEQKANSITSTVSSTYATKAALNTTNAAVATAQSGVDSLGRDLTGTKLGNLIVNGHGEYLDNTNFRAATFTRGDCPDDCYGYFNGATSTALIPFDPYKEYEYDYYCRLHAGRSGVSYFSVVPLDVDGNEIGYGHVLVYNENLFYLTKDLKDGDTVAYFTDLSKWRTDTSQSYQRSFLIFGYTDGAGYTYPDGTYSRWAYSNVYAGNSSVNTTQNTITLSSPWSGGTIAAGTCVGQTSAGSVYCYFGQAGTITNTEWKKWTGTISPSNTVPSDAIRLKYAKNIRIYLWNDVADYCGITLREKTIDSEARETANDASTRIATAESTIKQLSDSISMLVTDKNGTSMMTQTSNGWTFNIDGLQSALDQTSINLANLTESYGGTQATVNSLQSAVNDLGVLGEYIKIGTYEGEPCIELGESDSNFKVLITNTRIMFKEGSATPTYISNQTLITEKIDVEEEFKQGNYVWSVRANGNYGLMWKGD